MYLCSILSHRHFSFLLLSPPLNRLTLDVVRPHHLDRVEYHRRDIVELELGEMHFFEVRVGRHVKIWDYGKMQYPTESLVCEFGVEVEQT